MIGNLIRGSVRARGRVLNIMRPSRPVFVQSRYYHPDNVLMKRDEGEYFADPKSVAERVVRLMALHDNVKDPAAITLNSSFEELGLNSLDMAEVFLAAEKEFDLEIDEDECEGMTTVNDLVEFLAKNFYTK